LSLYGNVEIPELRLHVDDAFVADWAFVSMFDMLSPAVSMKGMAAFHVAHPSRRVEHVLAAYRAVAVQQSLNTPVVIFQTDSQTSIAFLSLPVS
jgi:uncharacterized protein YbjT (DUF2867 family)